MFYPVVYSSGCSCFIPLYTVWGVRVLSGGIQSGVFVFYPVVYSSVYSNLLHQLHTICSSTTMESNHKRFSQIIETINI